MQRRQQPAHIEPHRPGHKAGIEQRPRHHALGDRNAVHGGDQQSAATGSVVLAVAAHASDQEVRQRASDIAAPRFIVGKKYLNVRVAAPQVSD
jgi:hypothetical protein